jgi:lysophospholipase L1-like esterase
MELGMLSLNRTTWALLGALMHLGCGGSASPAESAAPASLDPAPETRAPREVSSRNSEAEAPEGIEDPKGDGEPDLSKTATQNAEPSPDIEDEPLGAEPATPPPLPEGTTVLHIGDSMAGGLGIELNKLFKEHGIRGILRYETSTFIPTWAWHKDLDRYLWDYRPDLVIVTLGGNELNIPNPEDRIPTIRKLVDRIGDRPCVWIEPALWEGARRDLMDVVAANCAPCVYLTSQDIAPTLDRVSDKIHLTMDARKVWADHVLDWLARNRDPSNPDRPWQMRGADEIRPRVEGVEGPSKSK